MSEVKIKFSVRSEPPFVVITSDPWHLDIDRRCRCSEESVRADEVKNVSVVLLDSPGDDEWGVTLEAPTTSSGYVMRFENREAAERFAADVRRCVMSSGLWRRG